jgi:hypothetical protein
VSEEHHLYARIPEELFQQLKALARLHKRSVASETELALELHVKQHAAELDGAEPGPPAGPRKKPRRRKEG